MQTAARQSDFEFVVGNRPDQLKGGSSRRLRSYLSRRAWQAHSQQQKEATRNGLPASSGPKGLQQGQRSSSSSESPPSGSVNGPVRPKRRRRKPQYSVTFEYTPNATGRQAHCSDAQPGFSKGNDHESNQQMVLQRSRSTDTSSSSARSTSTVPTIHFQLGGGRVDPFKSYAAPWQWFMPALVDHYLVHMAVDIPELDQPGSKGLLRSSWFRMVVSDAATFPVVMLLSAANFITVNTSHTQDLGLKDNISRMKLDAIQCINEAFGSEDRRISDGAIGAVAKMASFEAMHGDVQSYRMHMDGLKRMIDMRGGLYSLGLAGLLRRIVIWIDLNSAFLFQIPRYYPGQTFAGEEIQEPNPERFIGV